VLDDAHDWIDKAYEVEDMGELRKAVRAFVAEGLEVFYRQRRKTA